MSPVVKTPFLTLVFTLQRLTFLPCFITSIMQIVLLSVVDVVMNIPLFEPFGNTQFHTQLIL